MASAPIQARHRKAAEAAMRDLYVDPPAHPIAVAIQHIAARAVADYEAQIAAGLRAELKSTPPAYWSGLYRALNRLGSWQGDESDG